ncbi:hypothetical protein COV15_00610 [Candidatus Woesearchaeota archaeon CG10_big_fil_rev_8_21_14_0_10_34_12]|nr:MAG: hypothetical protein COV15_00610 [Candidatus Woesearchaeota archaeon CG10_big_fil_rev_8_21_14_0_10_34_12]
MLEVKIINQVAQNLKKTKQTGSLVPLVEALKALGSSVSPDHFLSPGDSTAKKAVVDWAIDLIRGYTQVSKAIIQHSEAYFREHQELEKQAGEYEERIGKLEEGYKKDIDRVHKEWEKEVEKLNKEYSKIENHFARLKRLR